MKIKMTQIKGNTFNLKLVTKDIKNIQHRVRQDKTLTYKQCCHSLQLNSGNDYN